MNARKVLGLVSPRWREPQTCDACREPFVCGAGVTGCWCTEISLTAETRASLKAAYRGCLCRRCLERAAEAETTPQP